MLSNYAIILYKKLIFNYSFESIMIGFEAEVIACIFARS